jgi:aminopeptidase N
VLSLTQQVPPTPGQPEKLPVPIPLRLALFDSETGAHRGEELIVMTAGKEEHRFSGWPTRPVLSINSFRCTRPA